MSKSSAKRKATDAAAVIDDIEQQVAKLRKKGPEALKSSDFVKFGNKLQAHTKKLKQIEVLVNFLSKKKEHKLKSIVASLLPPDMQHIEVEHADVFDDATDIFYELLNGATYYRLASCTFRDSDCLASEAHHCHIAVDQADGEAKIVFVCARGDTEKTEFATLRIPIDTPSDLDQFERDFSDTIRNKRPEYRKVLGTRPVWAYVLLSMLVYTEHVFAPLEQKDVQRVQRDVKKRRVHEVIGKFWTFGRGTKFLEQTIAPFLVRLMPPAFALKLNLQRDATLFE